MDITTVAQSIMMDITTAAKSITMDIITVARFTMMDIITVAQSITMDIITVARFTMAATTAIRLMLMCYPALVISIMASTMLTVEITTIIHKPLPLGLASIQ